MDAHIPLRVMADARRLDGAAICQLARLAQRRERLTYEQAKLIYDYTVSRIRGLSGLRLDTRSFHLDICVCAGPSFQRPCPNCTYDRRSYTGYADSAAMCRERALREAKARGVDTRQGWMAFVAEQGGFIKWFLRTRMGLAAETDGAFAAQHEPMPALWSIAAAVSIWGLRRGRVGYTTLLDRTFITLRYADEAGCEQCMVLSHRIDPCRMRTIYALQVEVTKRLKGCQGYADIMSKFDLERWTRIEDFDPTKAACGTIEET